MNFEELMSCHPKNKTVFNELVERMKENVVIPFIGAGLSAWIYPTWTSLIKNLAQEYGIFEEANQLLNQGKYEEAASLLEEEIVRNDFLLELHRIFGLSKLKDVTLPEYIKLIPHIWKGNIITTNFDRVIETVFMQEQIQIDNIVPHSAREKDRILNAIQQGLKLIIKLHGDIEDYNHLVLTKEEYDETYGKEEKGVDLTLPMTEMLTDIIHSKMMLFLGCGLGNDRTLQVIKACTNLRHFALVELPEETANDDEPYLPKLRNENGSFIPKFNERRKHLANHRISCIWYPHQKHEALEVLIKELARVICDLVPSTNKVDKNPETKNTQTNVNGGDNNVGSITANNIQGSTININIGNEAKKEPKK